jgi:hypothetical protein
MESPETGAVTVSSSGVFTRNPLSNFCWLQWRVNLAMGCEGFFALKGNITAQKTALSLGSSAYLLHAGGSHFKSQPRHQQS